MEYELVWAEPASEQLKAIRDYIAEQNPAAATKVVDKIVKDVERLRATPRLGSVWREGRVHPIRKIVSGKYRIFYRIVEQAQCVEILLVWHGARQDPDLPE